ncbi:DUF2254 domain-containing protein [Olleya sp. ITB9]|uniref:DUF2254 domain-containing protein n=1 Tax=Olleya sp. ITB9 TaxID=1715648 RepID=UPI0006D024D8|nr:DUF2254 domain-containing protein [Olleya sp. ITB9]
MKKIIVNGLEYFNKIESKIAFYPTLYSLAGMLFAFFMYYAENKGISSYLKDNIPFLVINNTETAFNILTTFIAGLISIMVFSFSMVMILLNQASSNFSPRVLPGLISNKRHQKILGIYNATLLFCIFTMVAIKPDADTNQLPGFSVLLAIVFMVFCLAAFIYFIHSISQEIQVHNIMHRLFKDAKNRLEQLIHSEKNKKNNFPNTENWSTFNSKNTGFLQDIMLEPFGEFANQNNNKFHVLAVKGQYIYSDKPLFKSESELNEEQIETLTSYFHFSKEEVIDDNYVLGFKQLTEIAVKAMSPGINDPGTASIAIDYLTNLFEIRLQKNETSLLFEDKEALVKINTISFQELLYLVLTPIRTYAKHDVIIIGKLIDLYTHLFTKLDNASNYKDVIINEINALYFDVENNISNPNDLEVISNKMKVFKL